MTAVILASQTVEAQQPTTLTLACKGTTTRHNTDGDEDAQPISMGIIVNFTDRTVQGFGPPNGMFDEPLKIGWTNDTTVVFGGNHEGFARSTVTGFIDRVTGDVQANWANIDKKGKLEPYMTYALQCRPTKRIF